MSPKDCAYIVERLAIRFMALVTDHERQLTEHRAAFGARTEADAKIIAGLRSEIGAAQMAVLERDSLISERDGLLTQVQDMRAEIERLQWENKTMHKDAEDGYAAAIKVLGDPVALSKERDALRAEVAALQERLRSSIARGDFAQMEVAALRSQNPKHSVATTNPVKMAVKIGDRVTMSRTPIEDDDYPVKWDSIWGDVGEIGKVVALGSRYGFAIAMIERESSNAIEWPLSCVEIVTEATHDTEAGKASAESALETESVAKGDLVKVFQATGSMTVAEDIGSGGVVHKVDGLWVWLDRHYTMGLPRQGVASLSDVRKVDTEAGKASAEAALKTEPVAEEIKVGDVVKVVGESGCLTAQSDIGKIGEVLKIDFGDGTVLLSGGAGWVNRCDVRKVTT